MLTMEDSKQRLRDHLIGHIPDIIKSLLQEVGSTPIRILGDTPNKALDSEDYLDSIRPFVSKVEDSLRQHRPDCPTCFLAVAIYPGRHSYFVVDFNNTRYDYDTAQHDKSLVPAYVLRLSLKNPRIYRKEPLDKTLAETLAELHNSHGREPLPLFDDHNQRRCYASPRSIEHILG